MIDNEDTYKKNTVDVMAKNLQIGVWLGHIGFVPVKKRPAHEINSLKNLIFAETLIYSGSLNTRIN